MKEANIEKKFYEEPTVAMVEFDFTDTVVTASSGACAVEGGMLEYYEGSPCYD